MPILTLKMMTYKATLTYLFHLLIHADGKIDQKEIEYGEIMASSEGIQLDEFRTNVKWLLNRDISLTYSDAVQGLRKCDPVQQIRAVAWLCVVANADGFMDRAEWSLIYKIYHKELRLPLDRIMSEQKSILLSIRDSAAQRHAEVLQSIL